MNRGERELYLARGVGQMGRYGPLNDQEDHKLYDFLSIFHSELSHAQRVAMVLAAHPDSEIKRL